jgi:hypothetical protein
MAETTTADDTITDIVPEFTAEEWGSPIGVAYAAERARAGYLLGTVERLLDLLDEAGEAAKAAGHAAELAAWNARLKLRHELGGIGDGAAWQDSDEADEATQVPDVRGGGRG